MWKLLSHKKNFSTQKKLVKINIDLIKGIHKRVRVWRVHLLTFANYWWEILSQYDKFRYHTSCKSDVIRKKSSHTTYFYNFTALRLALDKYIFLWFDPMRVLWEHLSFLAIFETHIERKCANKIPIMNNIYLRWKNLIGKFFFYLNRKSTTDYDEFSEACLFQAAASQPVVIIGK